MTRSSKEFISKLTRFFSLDQDIEADCSRLLETGLFARAQPTTQLPMATQAPDFIRDIDGHLNPVIPLNQVPKP